MDTMNTLDLLEIAKETVENQEILEEGGAYGKLPYLFQNNRMTFGEMRDIFRGVFKGETTINEKVDGQNLMVTYKDGGFKFARNKQTLKEPMDYSKLASHFDGNPKVKDAFVKSANDLGKALNSIDQERLNRFFEDGKRFLNVEIVYPPVKNLIDYGNKCILQLSGIVNYDSKFNPISEDKADSDEIYKILKSHNALKQEMFEITEPNILRIRNSVTADEALQDILGQLNKIVDGIGYKATIQDYANDRIKRHIINAGSERNIDIDRNSTFCEELADRLSHLSNKRPTKSDIATYAKKAGLNPRSVEYRNMMEYLESTSDEINENIMRPIEELIMNFGISLFKNLIGFLAADPSKVSQKIVAEFEDAVNQIQNGEVGLTENKMRIFKKNLRKLEKVQNMEVFTEGIILNYKGKSYKVTGSFKEINQICGLIKYR